jgi:hypothetical protein
MKKAPFDSSMGKKNHIGLTSMGKKEIPRVNSHTHGHHSLNSVLANLEQKKYNALERM